MQTKNAYRSELSAEEVELLSYFRIMSSESGAELVSIASAFSEAFPAKTSVIHLVKPRQK